MKRNLFSASKGEWLLLLLSFCTITASIFSTSTAFPDMLIDAKYYATWGFGIVAVCYIALYSIIFPKRILATQYANGIETSAMVVCIAQAVFFLLQKLGLAETYNEYGAGSFENIAGFASCLSISLPLGWQVCKNRGKTAQSFLYLSKILCIIAIVWSQSRTGMLCAIVCFAWKFCPRSKRKWGLLLFPILIFISLFYKGKSSFGRWFILQRTCDMIAEKPLFGWGHSGFEAHYMDFQADYFALHPTSEYIAVAGNVHHPLNEWMAATVDYGFFGLSIIILFFGFSIYYGLKKRSYLSVLGIRILVLIGIFSLFSYPFQYPFTWLMLAFSLWGIYEKALRRYSKSVSISMLCAAIPLGYTIGKKCHNDLLLQQIIEKSQFGLSKKMLPRYEQLYPSMKNDSRFLFYYASDLYLAEQYSLALQKAKECQVHYSDYKLSLLIGDIYNEMGRKDSAQYHYHRAKLMFPRKKLTLP